MSKGKTIRIHLVDGEPAGVRTAELTTSILKAWVVPRKRLSEEGDHRQDLKQPGVYFLIGLGDEKPPIYIGQSQDCMDRLKQHDDKKDFWNQTVVFIKKDKLFTPTDLSFLEREAIQQANDADRSKSENSQTPKEISLDASMRDDCHQIFDMIKILMGTLGFSFLDKLNKTPSNQDLAIEKNNNGMNQDFFIKNDRGADAQGKWIDEGFLILKDSVALKDIKTSCSPATKKLQEKWIQDGYLKERDATLLFLKDALARSPSGASSLILCRSSNGKVEWKTQGGKTLKDVEDELSNPETVSPSK